MEGCTSAALLLQKAGGAYGAGCRLNPVIIVGHIHPLALPVHSVFAHIGYFELLRHIALQQIDIGIVTGLRYCVSARISIS